MIKFLTVIFIALVNVVVSAMKAIISLEAKGTSEADKRAAAVTLVQDGEYVLEQALPLPAPIAKIINDPNTVKWGVNLAFDLFENKGAELFGVITQDLEGWLGVQVQAVNTNPPPLVSETPQEAPVTEEPAPIQ